MLSLIGGLATSPQAQGSNFFWLVRSLVGGFATETQMQDSGSGWLVRSMLGGLATSAPGKVSGREPVGSRSGQLLSWQDPPRASLVRAFTRFINSSP